MLKLDLNFIRVIKYLTSIVLKLDLSINEVKFRFT